MASTTGTTPSSYANPHRHQGVCPLRCWTEDLPVGVVLTREHDDVLDPRIRPRTDDAERNSLPHTVQVGRPWARGVAARRMLAVAMLLLALGAKWRPHLNAITDAGSQAGGPLEVPHAGV
jgi:hypothetical protein